MTKHHTDDYKITVVNYYISNNTSYANVCKIFNCSERSLKRWIERYRQINNVSRNNRRSVSYKVEKNHVDYITSELKKNEQITMSELLKIVQKKYPEFIITPQHLGRIIRDNNITRKRTRHEHFPYARYGNPIDKKDELNKFYKEINKYSLDKIISIDETSISPAMIKEYSRCKLGKRCIYKTSDIYVFRKFTLIVAIKNSKCIGWHLYKQGGMTKEILVDFYQKYISGKYRKHLIILDNAGSHKNSLVQNAITISGNKYLYSIPYTPTTNPIENFFSQLKHYLKLNKKVLKFDDIKIEIKNAIAKIKPEHYKNYFLYAYKKEELKLPSKNSTRQKKLKNYRE